MSTVRGGNGFAEFGHTPHFQRRTQRNREHTLCLTNFIVLGVLFEKLIVTHLFKKLPLCYATRTGSWLVYRTLQILGSNLERNISYPVRGYLQYLYARDSQTVVRKRWLDVPSIL
jgi:hypothetical protein